MSMSNNQAKEPIVYVRKKIRKIKRLEEVVENVVTYPHQQDFSPKIVGEKSIETLKNDPNKLLVVEASQEKKWDDNMKIQKEAKSKKGTKKSLNTRRCKGEGRTANVKISENEEERRKMWKPQASGFNKYKQILTTEEQTTNWNQLALVDRNIEYYVNSQMEFSKDLGETAQRLAHKKVCSLDKSLQCHSPPNTTVWSTFDAKRKGKMVQYQENNTMDFADFYAQRGNKGISIREESGQEVHYQNINSCKNYQVMSPTFNVLGNKPRTIVHPSKIIPSTFSKNSDQRTISETAPSSFSYMKLLMEDDTEDLLGAKEFLSTYQGGVSLEEQRAQQWPSQVGNQFGNTWQNVNSQSCHQYQVWQQPQQQISFMDLLTREDLYGLDMLELDSVWFPSANQQGKC